MTFNGCADSLIRHQFARAVDEKEGMDLLQQAYERNLVQFGENVRQRVSFICNCCSCCCEAMIAAQRFAYLHPVHTTNYLPEITDGCSGCASCVEICPVHAIDLRPVNENGKKKRAFINEEICLGCGVCARNCSKSAIRLQKRKERIITPLNSAHKTVMMAIERGNLQHLIFANQAFASHRAMAAILGVILKAPPLKQILAGEQLKSRYLEKLLQVKKYN